MRLKDTYTAMIFFLSIAMPLYSADETVILAVGTKITVYCRIVRADTNALTRSGKFEKIGFINALETSFGPGITGAQIYEIIKAQKKNIKIVKLQALSVKKGVDPSNVPCSMIIVNNSPDEYYDTYILLSGESAPALYIDINVLE